MLSLKSLILSELSCFNRNLEEDTKQTQEPNQEDFYLLIERNKTNLINKMNQEEQVLIVEEPVKEEPVKEEPVKEEPVKEELVLIVESINEEPVIIIDEPLLSINESINEEEPLSRIDDPIIVDEEPLNEEPLSINENELVNDQDELEDELVNDQNELEDELVNEEPLSIDEEEKINHTKQWLFHPAFDRYEKIQKEFCKNLTTYTSFKIKQCDHLDKVSDFLIWMVESDCLKSEILKGREPNLGAIWHFFTQWMIRSSLKQGQDVLLRELEGARTQAETQKKSLGLEEKIFEAPIVARQVKNENGTVLDMFLDDQEDIDMYLREETLNNNVLRCLRSKFPNDYEFYHQLFLDKLNDTYPNSATWSKSLNMTERQLLSHLALMTKKLRSFGRDAFIS